jgi:hypothetical protein
MRRGAVSPAYLAYPTYMEKMMITVVMATLLVPIMLFGAAAFAADDQKTDKQSAPTQAQLALDHGPRAQVTPAVKRARVEAAQAASTPAPSK